MASIYDESLAKYLEEAYVSKYAKYLEDDDNDEDWDYEDEDDEEDDKKSSTKSSKDSSDKNPANGNDKKHEQKENPPSLTYLSTTDISKIRNIAIIVLSKYSKLKKCCDYVDLRDKDHINDDGNRESELGKYYHSGDPKSFIKIMDGDVFSGYPDFRNGGNEAYEKDSKAFCKEMNEMLEDRGIKAKWCEGPNRDDEAISFGVRSTKTKQKN